MDYQEVELKLRLTQTSYNYFIENYAALWSRVQHNYFMDTKDFDLLKTKWVFRLRDEGDRAYMTLKGPSKVEKGVYSRPEFEEAISLANLSAWRKSFSVNSIPLGQLAEAPISWPQEEFREYASFTNRRTAIDWQGYTLEIDCFTIGEKIFYELECETSPEKLNELSKMLKDFFSQNNFEYTFSELSKFRVLIQETGIKT